MAKTLSQTDVELDFLIQLQTDFKRMPIEDASIEWPERLSPFVPVAKITIPKQEFTSPEQMVFARELSFNPWHCYCGTPATRQSKPRQTGDLLRTLPLAPINEQ